MNKFLQFLLFLLQEVEVLSLMFKQNLSMEIMHLLLEILMIRPRPYQLQEQLQLEIHSIIIHLIPTFQQQVLLQEDLVLVLMILKQTNNLHQYSKVTDLVSKNLCLNNQLLVVFLLQAVKIKPQLVAILKWIESLFRILLPNMIIMILSKKLQVNLLSKNLKVTQMTY